MSPQSTEGVYPSKNKADVALQQVDVLAVYTTILFANKQRRAARKEELLEKFYEEITSSLWHMEPWFSVSWNIIGFWIDE